MFAVNEINSRLLADQKRYLSTRWHQSRGSYKDANVDFKICTKLPCQYKVTPFDGKSDQVRCLVAELG